MKPSLLVKSAALRVLLLCCALGCAGSAAAQSRVAGRVTDAAGSPMIGVSVVVQGTGTGTVTSASGAYAVAAKATDTLVFSFLGYRTQRIPVSGRAAIDVKMAEEAEAIDDVVVVGYGSQKKVNVTGAVSSIGEAVLKDRGAVSNVVSSLQGAMPGVVVTRNSPAVGREGWDIKIRGEASVNSIGALVLVDGVPGTMDDINPADIENISVLKDASAAIYGARAAGGVILVTTKKGGEGAPKVTYKGSFEVKSPSLQVDWLSMSQYAYIFEEGVINDGSVAAFQGARDQYGNIMTGINTGSVYKTALTYGLIQEMKKGSRGQYANTVQPYNYGGRDIGFFDTDPNDLLWKNAVSQSHSVAISGGTKNNQYNLSLGYMQDNSMLKIYDEYSKRYNFRVNDQFKVSKHFDVNVNAAYDRRKTDYSAYNAVAITGMPIGSPMETPSGNLYSWGSQTSSYGLTRDGGSIYSYTNRFSLNVQPTVTILDGLTLVGRASLISTNAEEETRQNAVTWYNYADQPSNSGAVVDPKTNAVTKFASSNMREEYQLYVDYKRSFASAHNMAAMAGVSYENYRGSNFSVTGDNLSTGAIHSLNTAALFDASDNVNEYAIASYFGRLNYDYKGRYLVEVLGRYDGSSRFKRGHRWQPFFGASAGWRISEEEWMRSNGIFTNLKLRLSYGETGNQAGIGAYDYYATIDQVPGSSSSALFGTSYADYIKYGSMVSYNRTWERVATTNIGLDFSVLRGRLSGTVDLFQRVNDDMLVSVTYPQVLGATAPKTNSGKLEVKGWEVGLQWRDRIGQVAYWVGANISDSRNELVRMEGRQTKTWNGITSALEGYALGTIWGLEAIKLIETEEELAAYKPTVGNVYAGAQNELKVGDVMYRDLDGDGFITKDDVKLIGDIAPHYSFALNLGASWKNLDFSCQFQGVGRQHVLRSANSSNTLGYSWFQLSSARYFDNHWTTVREQCEAAGDTRATLPVNRDPNAAPRVAYLAGKNYNYLASDAWWSVQNAAYVRLKNVVVGYTLPKRWMDKVKLDKVRVYVAGNDLFTICNVKDGYDPENRNYSNAGNKSFDNYPFARSFIGGIDITF